MLYLIFFLFSFQSLAWQEPLPEYSGMTLEDAQRIEKAESISSEYQTDLLSYDPSISWLYGWLTHPNAMNVSLGSLSGKHFYLFNRVKLTAPLNETWNFKFNFFDVGNFEQVSTRYLYEFENWVTPNQGWSIYGKSSYRKSEDDMGLAYLFRPHADHVIRFFYTCLLVSRNNRNEKNDYFKEGQPFSAGIVGRKIFRHNKSFLQYYIRGENSYTWRFEDEQRDYKKQLVVASTTYRHAIDENTFENIKLDMGSGREGFYPFSDVNPVSEADSKFGIVTWQRETAAFLYGLQYSYRELRANNADILQKNFIPHLKFFRLPHTLGLQTSFYNAKGAGSSSYATDVRLDYGYRWIFSESASFELVATFDMDRFGTEETWEGGAGFWRWEF